MPHSRAAKNRMRGRTKVHKVMGEFKRGTLRSSSGSKVTSHDQAVAIAMSEAGLSRRKRRRPRQLVGGIYYE